MEVTLLGGGIGASRFSKALAAVVPPEKLTCIVNTGDDLWRYGLRICPDLDTTLYAHAGLKDEQRGWGLKGESFRAMERIRALGQEAWFNLGDLDLATHLLRTEWLRAGLTLTEITQRLAEAVGVRLRVLPMTDSEVETHIRVADRQASDQGWLHYQQFLVQRKAQDTVEDICYTGSLSARPGAGVVSAITQAKLVIIGPSNPVASIQPILSLPGIRQALAETQAPVMAITPIVSGVPIHDPGEANRARSRTALMAAHGLPHRASAVAGLYRDFVDVFVLDEADREEASEIEALGLTVVIAPTLFHIDTPTATCATASATAATVARLLQVGLKEATT